MSGTPFYKMTGSGNDFVMLDGRDQRPEDWPEARIVSVCDRRMGIGADGLVLLTPVGEDRVRMDFWNCDGSRAAMCGNAALCSTRLATDLGMVPAAGMQLVTAAGTFPCRVGHQPHQAELNLPDFDAPTVPRQIEPGAGESALYLATVGVPHLVVRVQDIEQPDLMARGRLLRNDPGAGPEGANVNFVAPPDGQESAWRVRTYERGVEGETLACGTGAVAVGAALIQSGAAESPVKVETRSGRLLRITLTMSGGRVSSVWLAGEGRLVFRGTLLENQ